MVPRIYPMRLSGLISSIPLYSGKAIGILRLQSNIAPDGSSYKYAYDTENGICVQESDSLVAAGPESALSARGSYQYTSPEGVLV
ncbi:endocuticle structural glycoprotein SgAbd-1-like [Anoplophora glabripennis]|uniref:endocuticle structural glycoprotein SgAbd-1-like n=1 Tax=Anoplophora glabripennis TaxID=217634 RepID=UPI000873C323|nr:endocuticle structural glycoprotein SgAbd-1-like [Anoplophora glabripennis]